MKLLPRILFVLIVSFLFNAHAEEKPEYLASFDPAKGFKPAQRDLTEVFLQLAGSLEAYGSPVPYISHVVEEQKKFEVLYQQKYGKAAPSIRPDYLTDAYLEKLSSNWTLLSPKIGLEPYAKEFGNLMRDAVKGTRATGTTAVDIFNQHQARVFANMSGKGNTPADFSTLQRELVSRLELENPTVNEDKFEVARRDAITFSLAIKSQTKKLFGRIEAGLKPDAAQKVEAVLKSIIIDTGTLAESELRVAIAAWAINDPSTAAR